MINKATEATRRVEVVRIRQGHKLDLFGFGLTELPPMMAELKELRELDLSGNVLTILPDFLANLNKLKLLDLSGNGLVSLPPWLAELKELEELRLSYNKLLELPRFIGNLNNLVWISAKSCGLEKLPDTVGRLRNLKYLFLPGNRLTEIPAELGRLSNLVELDLSYNLLSDLPDSLRTLKALKTLYLHGNTELSVPIEVLGKERSESGFNVDSAKPLEILEYYFRLRGGKRPLNEAKLILVGRGAVGKTSIVNRLVHNQFKDEKKTEGIRITEWRLVLDSTEKVRLNIWDFGGQEIMHATHQFFLTQRSLYLLVLNGREGGEDSDAEYWLKLIESFGGESPVIVVMNKIKEHPFDLNRRALSLKYPMIAAFVKTDCEDGTGFSDLLRSIKTETDLLEHLRDSFPTSWFKIKDKLASMKKNFLSFEEYRKQCAILGEKDRESQDALAVYLHSLGIALNYKDDPRLQDTHVLNPRWVTDGIYRVLNANKLEKQKGEIRLDDLAEILDPEEYPLGMRRFLFDLMKKFELCFSFPEDDTHYLIPELLDKQEPLKAADFTREECLNFQYSYPVLPEGLLPRFIVRTHGLSEKLPRWRTGVILQFEESQALVKADVQDKKIFISVRGPSGSRRRLLAIIRSDFERIHRDIRNLQPEQVVPLPDYPFEEVRYQELLVMEGNELKRFPKVVGNQIIEFDVVELLDGVDLEGTRRRDKRERIKPLRVFISYSHKDENLRVELESHLKILQRLELIDTWHDRKIEPGHEWARKIDEKLEESELVLFLVSSHFIASDYCYDREMKLAINRHKAGIARVIPIIVRDVNWSKAPFATLQALPKDGRAVELWEHPNSAWRDISEGIENAVDEIRNSRRST